MKSLTKVRDHCLYTGEESGAAHNICKLKYSVPKEISIVFHNGSNNDYHFIIKELAEEFEEQFTSLKKITKKKQPFQLHQKNRLQEMTKTEKKL